MLIVDERSVFPPPGRRLTAPWLLTLSVVVASKPEAISTLAAPLPATFHVVMPARFVLVALGDLSVTLPAVTLNVLAVSATSDQLIVAGLESPERMSVPAPSLLRMRVEPLRLRA